MSGRPLRFLGTVAGGWIGLRVILLWPTIDSAPALLRALLPLARAAAPRHPSRAVAAPELVARLPVTLAAAPAASAAPVPARKPAADPERVAMALLGLVRFGETDNDGPVVQAGLPRPVPATPTAAKRWSGSAWAIGRGSGGASAGLVGGQLGGSQAGARVAYLLDRVHRVAVAARITSPLGPGQRELALGVEWQPTRLPVRIVAEHRFAVDGGHGGPAVGVVGGAGPLDIGGGFRLEGYGQAGAIGREGEGGTIEGFVDGAVRAARPVLHLGGVRIDLGAGLWGAAQRGASRVDLGPSMAVVVPIARQAVRLSLDWRERIVGNARPGSGPALSLGADF